jgi:hypothetical protein
MRITREMLLKVAQETVAQRSREDLRLLSVYLHGSVLNDEPLLGGTADVDLFFVHDDGVKIEREIVKVTDEIHLDIAHYSRKSYLQTRELRLHPWLGPTIYGCKILYDPQHFMDFVQASVRGQFYRSDHVLDRVRPQIEQARKMWLSFVQVPSTFDTDIVGFYLRAVGLAANSIAGLTGSPLTERRFLLKFADQARALNQPGLYVGLLGLLGGPTVDTDTLRSWLPTWQSAIEAIPEENRPVALRRERWLYYLRAFETTLDSDRPLAILWPLLNTWVRAVRLLPATSRPVTAWQAAAQHLGLMGPGFLELLSSFDGYLDRVEEAVEHWASANGA